LELSSGVKIGVGIYSFIRRAAPPKPVKINKRNNEVATKTVNKFRGDTGATILKSEEVSVVEMKGEQVIFRPDELKSVKYIYEPGIKLLGFLDQSDLDHFAWFHSDGYFLYPDEDRWNGSKDFFTALLRRCHALKKVAIVKMVISRGRTPRLGCLIPTIDETIGQNQKLPEGFQLFKLPFADEIRQVPFDWTQDFSPDQNLVNILEKVIKKTNNKNFDVLTVQNPALQNKWREIEAAVLDDDGAHIAQDDFLDYTEPNMIVMEQRIGDLSSEVMESSIALAGAFRANSATITKKPKMTINMAMEVKNKRVEKLTCDILREFLDGVGFDTKRKVKAALVAAVYAHFA
jgi:ATP-dependent DNA helicase 2 subunit 1